MPKFDDSMDDLMHALAVKLGETIIVAEAQGRVRSVVLQVLQFFLGAAEAHGDSELRAIIKDNICALEPLVGDEASDGS